MMVNEKARLSAQNPAINKLEGEPEPVREQPAKQWSRAKEWAAVTEYMWACSGSEKLPEAEGHSMAGIHSVDVHSFKPGYALR
ncbi:MAG: hypothetical protein K0Q90_1681 [Paenibacillaceae bacterium]|nr:hypothetical protein [Paenibacillaceae bacterium]